jgi:hypothetical protein
VAVGAPYTLRERHAPDGRYVLGLHAKAQSFATLLDFINYPSPKDSFTVNWHAPTPFTLPTPMKVFPDGQVYKKLRQDALVKDDTATLVLDSIRTYLPTYGNDWAYSCKARNACWPG